MKVKQILQLLFIMGVYMISCKKSSSDTVAPTVQTPKLGTTWTYQQDNYISTGTSYITTTVHHKATSEVSFGGETWLKITDDTLAVVYLLNTKTGGLYQYANNTSDLLCKYPATLNDVYNTFNYGGSETFTVKDVGISIGSANGSSYTNINYYEGVKSGEMMDKIWFNNEVWFARRETYKHEPVTNLYRRDKRLILYSISY